MEIAKTLLADRPSETLAFKQSPCWSCSNCGKPYQVFHNNQNKVIWEACLDCHVIVNFQIVVAS